MHPYRSSVSFKQRAAHITLICLLLLCSMLFIVRDRLVVYDRYDGEHQWLSASTVKYVNDWLAEGATADRFLLYEDARSVEFEQYNRRVYVSYPPGTVIPVYIAARLCGKQQVSVSFIKYFVLFEYGCMVLLLGVLFYVVLCWLGIGSVVEKTLVPVVLAVIWALLPFNYYYLRNVFFSDQAVLLVALLFFINEFLLITADGRKQARKHHWFSFLLVFAGVFTDYYFIPVVMISFLLRSVILFQESKGAAGMLARILAMGKRTADLFAGTVLALLLFLQQISAVPEGYKMLREKFFERTAVSADNAAVSFDLKAGLLFLAAHFREAFGSVFTCLLPLFVILTMWLFARYRRDKKRRTLLYIFLLVSCSAILHTALLMNHSVIHKFSMLKYGFVFTQLVFTSYCWIQLQPRLLTGVPLVLKKGLLVIAFVYMVKISYLQAKPFYLSNTGQNSLQYPVLDAYLQKNASYNQVVFSPDIQVDPNPPFDISITRKRVYKVDSLQEVITRPLPDKAAILLLISDSTASQPGWALLKQFPARQIPGSGFSLVNTTQQELKSRQYNK
jgi:hypothetical protein